MHDFTTHAATSRANNKAQSWPAILLPQHLTSTNVLSRLPKLIMGSLLALTLASPTYAEGELPLAIANMLNTEERVDDNANMPDFIADFNWHARLKNKTDDNKILDTLWDSKTPENKIAAMQLISQNYQSYAVYDWLKQRVIYNNDFELAPDLIEQVSKQHREEASFWLHYYTLSALEDAAQCTIERKRKRSINTVFREAKHLNDLINLPETESLAIANEAIAYAESRNRSFWNGACGVDDEQNALRVTDKTKRAQIKYNIRKNYPTLFKQNVLR